MMGFLPRITIPFSKMTMTIPPAESLQPVYTVLYCTVNSSPSTPLLINQSITNQPIPSHYFIALVLITRPSYIYPETIDIPIRNYILLLLFFVVATLPIWLWLAGWHQNRILDT